MFVGALLTGVLFALIWALPAGWSEMGYFACFLGMSLLYYTALTVFMVPWGALGLEMTADYDERTRIQAVGNFFGNVGAILIPWPCSPRWDSTPTPTSTRTSDANR